MGQKIEHLKLTPLKNPVPRINAALFHHPVKIKLVDK